MHETSFQEFDIAHAAMETAKCLAQSRLNETSHWAAPMTANINDSASNAGLYEATHWAAQITANIAPTRPFN